MSTSLSEQLRRLAVPQSSLLLDSRRRVSILYDPKEAATKTRKTIYEIGCSGLQELICLNAVFQKFESTLFNETTLELERSVEHKEVNKVLDKNIRKFLQNLSPYFMLRPAHLCIEWLLRRFHIHEYNKQDFLGLILPYHETNIFVKCLQTISIKGSDTEWEWLKCLQKPGLPLAKTTLLNRAATQPAFLKFICQTTMDSVKELGPRAHLLQAQINLYASVVVGALDRAAAIEEWHIVTILPSLLKALTSDTMDFTSAGLIIISQLVSRTQLKLKLLNAFISKVVNVHFEQLRTAAILLLIWIFDTQASMEPEFSRQSLLTLVHHKWLTTCISTLTKEGVAVHSLCSALIKSAVQAIQKREEMYVFKSFLEQLINDVQFPDEIAFEIIGSFLDSYNEPPKAVSSSEINDNINGNGIIEIDSDDDMGESNKDFKSWFVDYMQKLERQYPNAFDKTIKEALKSNMSENSNRSKAMKMALRYRLKTFDMNSTDIYENLYHHTAKIRAYAVQTLIANINQYQSKPQNYELLKQCLADRILDDSRLVVEEVLKLPTKAFIDILGHSTFVNALLGILAKSTLPNEEKWNKLASGVVKHLTVSDIVQHYDANLLLLALMPFLFPNKSYQNVKTVIETVLRSPFVEKMKFLKDMKVNICEVNTENKETDFDTIEFKRQFLDIISKSQETPNILELIRSMKTQGEIFFKQPTRCAHFIMLATACIKQPLSGSEALIVFDIVRDCTKHFALRYMENHDWDQLDNLNFIPLQLVADLLNTLTRHTTFHNLQNWEHLNVELEFCLKVLQLLCNEAFAHERPHEKLEWTKMLKEFLVSVFPQAQDKFEFLLNFCIYENLDFIENYLELRIRSFALLNSMLRNYKQNNIVVKIDDLLKVLVPLNSPHETFRLQAMKTLESVLAMESLESNLLTFLEQVLQRKSEINMDEEQFPLVLYTILNPTEKRNKRLQQSSKWILSEIIKKLTVSSSESVIMEAAVFKAELLQMLKHVSDDQLLMDVIPLSLRILQKINNSITIGEGVKMLKPPDSRIYQLICERFDHKNIENILIDCSLAWQLFENIFSSHDVYILQEGQLVPLPCVFLNCLDEFTYDKMPDKYQLNFIKLIIKSIANSENDSILLAADKLLRRCSLNCQPLSLILQEMYKNAITTTGQNNTKENKRKPNAPQQLQLKTPAWREGEVLLELLENKKKLIKTECLIPPLFDLLKLCLSADERQNDIEFFKQLILSSLLNCCQQAKLDGIELQTAMAKTTFHIDQIVHCLRATPNPQTHHNALMLLSHCASLFPQQVLLNIVDIFTFMGSSVARYDDAFSFQLISNVLETILPILVNSGGGDSGGNSKVIPVLKVFSDIMLDVPEHRRLPLYIKFMHTLDAEEFLWMFLCIVFEYNVADDEKSRLIHKKHTKTKYNANNEKLAKRLEMCHSLIKEFPPQVSMRTCIELMNYVRKLPQNKEAMLLQGTTLAGSQETALFDTKVHSDKELRHYKYIIMQFMSTFTSSPEFVQQIATLTPEGFLQLKPYFQNFIIATLSYLPAINVAMEKTDDNAQKFWKVLLHHLHDILDNSISLLSSDMFLFVVNGLIQHKLLSVRKKVIELLITKLNQRDEYFEGCDNKHFKSILKQLNNIAIDNTAHQDDTPSHHSTDFNFLQQTSLIAIKVMSRSFALQLIDDFKEILFDLIKIVKKRKKVAKIIFATTILTMIEVASNLKAHSLSLLPKLMPLLIDVLGDQSNFVQQNPPDNITVAIIAGMYKLLEAMPLFLGPYLVDIIVNLSAIGVRIEQNVAEQTPKDQRSTIALQKVTSIWTKIAAEIPARILIPTLEKAYVQTLASKKYVVIRMIMKLLLDSMAATNDTDLATMRSELSNFFISAVEFREQALSDGLSDSLNVASVETWILDGFVAWILKLSENSFRPLYYRLSDWALKGKESTERLLTFFMLSNKIAGALKSLFVLFAGEIIEDAAKQLNKHNSQKNEINSDSISVELLKSILGMLSNIFLYDSKGFININRFDILMPPIVDQLENRLVYENEDLQKILLSCASQLSVTVANDVMCKQLNQQVLLKTRSNVPEVRILAFSCCVEIARKLGDTFTTLLPETVPFIAELFEDENPRVEQITRKYVHELENILGESLQKYL